MVFAAGLSYRYVVGAILCGLPVAVLRPDERGVSAPPADGVLGSLERSARRRVPGHPVADRGRIRRVLRAAGFMAGVQKLFYLPEPHTDFIYAVIGEEFGLVGTTIVLACFVVIAWRGFKIAMQAPDRFGAFLAVGLTTMIAAQAFFNISVVLGLVPTKGIPLPFVSAGGSSLLISLLGMGILLNVSQHAAPGS